MAAPPDLDPDHYCGWRTEAERLQVQLDVVRAELDALKRHVYGKKSEKVTPIDRELRKGQAPDRDAAGSPPGSAPSSSTTASARRGSVRASPTRTASSSSGTTGPSAPSPRRS